MQLAGSRFTDATAVFGNDLATLPDFPAEIRAPAGTVAGVSAFQIHFASRDILTPGDTPDVLVAMNPAALKANLGLMRRGATILVNEDAFSKRAVQKAGYEHQPARGRDARGLHRQADPDELADHARRSRTIEGVSSRDAQKAKNLFALGVLSWLYDRPTEVTEKWIRAKFSGPVMEANLAAFRAGWSFGETSEMIDVQVKVARNTEVRPGTYRNVNGTEATALGLVAASIKSGLPLVFGAYPITPASDLLHALSRRQDLGVRTIQAEDEIAAASMAARRGVRRRAGRDVHQRPGARSQDRDDRPGRDARAADGDHRRPARRPVDRHADQDRAVGPAAGAVRAPRRVAAAGAAPRQARDSRFEAVYEAVRIAVTYRTPVILLSDLFVANSSEPWAIPSAADLPAIDPRFRTTPADDDAVPPVRTRRPSGAAVGDPRHARARAPDRRPGEAGRDGRDLLRRRPTTRA